MGHSVRRLGDTVDELGEGAMWDARRGRAYTLDIVRGLVFEIDPGAEPGVGSVRSLVSESDRAVTFVAPTADGELLLVERDRLVLRSERGEHRVGRQLLGDPARRFNDGAVDPQGRLLIGTLREGPGEPDEVLLRIDGSTGECETLLTGLTLSNGIGFDASGTSMFHVDTLSRTVREFDYRPSVPVLRSSFEVDRGYPDGLTVDADGMLWVAIWGGGEVRRISPSGEVLDRLRLPAENVTSPAFIGAALDRLLVTTATQGLEAPGSGDGGLYLADVGTAGFPSWAIGETRGFFSSSEMPHSAG